MPLYHEHPLRQGLNDEVHARPAIPLPSEGVVSYLAFLHEESDDFPKAEIQHLAELAAQWGLPAPDGESGHAFLEASSLCLKWERHTEFTSYTFIRCGQSQPSFPLEACDPLEAIPAAWRRAIPGQLMVATQVQVKTGGQTVLPKGFLEDDASGKPRVGAKVGTQRAWVFTDFRIHEGFSRYTLVCEDSSPRQLGHTVQRLLEIETYRTMALLAFPVARQVRQFLSKAEEELALLMARMKTLENPGDEHALLESLIFLAASVEHSLSQTTFRFGAASAYYRLVLQRIDELDESPLPGFQSLGEFMARRLAPAMDTCASVARRQEDLSARIARNSQLLRTRVDIELERQNQALLAQMNQRARLQFQLQETVEGLSIVAITYYGSQLVHYLSKGLKSWIEPATPELLTALAIPLIAGMAALGLRRLRQSVAH
jgi:uncharacterized membrane-anchored protein